jgi:hypothetical protein
MQKTGFFTKVIIYSIIIQREYMVCKIELIAPYNTQTVHLA